MIFFAVLFVSCGDFGAYSLLFNEKDVESRFNKFADFSEKSLSLDSLPSKYTGLVITDIHFGSDKTRHDTDFFKWLADFYDRSDDSMKPRFMVCLGDIAEHGWESEFRDYNQFVQKVKDIAVEKLHLATADDFPSYTILGNHDLYNNGWEDWKNLVYPYNSSYYFDVGKFRFYALDTANGSIGNEQLEDFESLIKKDLRPKIVLSHYPIFSGGRHLFEIHDSYERNRLIADFAKNNVPLILEGHVHEYKDYSWGNFTESIVGSFLAYRKFAVVTMDETDGSVKMIRFTY